MRCSRADDSLALLASTSVAAAEIAGVHQRLEVTHPYRSEASGWLFLERSVLYYLERCTEEMCEEGEEGEECFVSPGNRAKILGIGNPAVWWPALLAYPLLAWRLLRRRDGRAAFLLAFVGLQYLPRFLVDRPGYLFYVTPVVPFIVLSLAYGAGLAAERRWLRWVPTALAFAACATCVYFLPLWLGTELPDSEEQARLWLSSWRGQAS